MEEQQIFSLKHLDNAHSKDRGYFGWEGEIILMDSYKRPAKNLLAAVEVHAIEEKAI